MKWDTLGVQTSAGMLSDWVEATHLDLLTNKTITEATESTQELYESIADCA